MAPALRIGLMSHFHHLALNTTCELLQIDKSKEALENTILSGDVDLLLKLKEAEKIFIENLKQLNVNIETLNTKPKKKKTDELIQKALAIITSIGFLIVLFFLLFINIPTDSKEIILLLLGVLSNSVTLVLSFYFGSSSSNNKQTSEKIDANQ